MGNVFWDNPQNFIDHRPHKKCCICGKEIEGEGNNPEPVKSEGVCCDECNENVVISARLSQLGL